MERHYRILSVYSHKGGVGKTTLVDTIARSNSRGLHFRRILLVDLDTQMNLTCKILGSEARFEDYINSLVDTNTPHHQLYRGNQDIKSKLTRINDYQAREDLNPNPIFIEGRTDGYTGPCIHLLPGYPELNQISRQMSLELDQPGAPLNICRSINHLIEQYCRQYKYDLVILDLGPDLYAVNSCALWGSDYVLMPCTADIYSAMSFRLMSQHIFPQTGGISGPPHPFLRFNSRLKVVGFIPNRVKTHGQAPIRAQSEGITKLEQRFGAHLGAFFHEQHYQEKPRNFHPTYIKLIGSGNLTGNETRSLYDLDISDETERNLLQTSLTELVLWLNSVLI